MTVRWISGIRRKEKTLTASNSFEMGRGLICVLALAVVLLLAVGCGDDINLQYKPTSSINTEASPTTERVLSETARVGEGLFNNNCLQCHGANALGTKQGPPLIHRFYEPGHHSDASIRSAAANGVPQHHWSFGDMPPVPDVSPDDVEKIICYLRETQRANGIFEGNAYPTVC